ncbi:AraC family transcriptional regulator [Nordella sp. HKS 07]|uniref:AraC family transcriptional regulator ligand-binding domain-containing protein n=1 Tax=Nordella sp. HKS 07 TaxID=2712222 RepID=UPI0013E1D874|nr:AraC family transcriptional regulator [Nordella sp. HKS 07]
MAYLGIASDTLETALRSMCRYSRIFSEALQADLTLDGSSGTLSSHPSRDHLPNIRQVAEFRHGIISAREIRKLDDLDNYRLIPASAIWVGITLPKN